MKKYTRKGLIRYFEKLPPRSRPCKVGDCPIARYLKLDSSGAALEYDIALAVAFDKDKMHPRWCDYTAAQIVKIAKAARHV